MTPFVLMGRRKLPPESGPSDDQIYDENWQLWINKKSGTPLVTDMRAHPQPSPFGETTMTDAPEGTDRAGVVLQASQFGETTMTQAPEGADRAGPATFEASQFGETTITRTQEGADQTEVATIEASRFGETTLTKTVEGADQTEVASLQVFDA